LRIKRTPSGIEEKKLRLSAPGQSNQESTSMTLNIHLTNEIEKNNM